MNSKLEITVLGSHGKVLLVGDCLGGSYKKTPEVAPMSDRASSTDQTWATQEWQQHLCDNIFKE